MVHRMVVNSSKTKEMIIHSRKNFSLDGIAPICIDSNSIERFDCFKLLGVFVTSDLTWDVSVTHLFNKVAKRFCRICYLVCVGVRENDILTIYCSIIQTPLEYACPVWHPGITKKLSKDIERVQKQCLKMIYSSLLYSQALMTSGLNQLDEWRENITMHTFRQIKDSAHPFHPLLPPVKNSQMYLRPTYQYRLPVCQKQIWW